MTQDTKATSQRSRALLVAGVLGLIAGPLEAESLVDVVREDREGVVLSVRVPDDALAVDVDPRGERRMSLEGAALVSSGGHPELPVIVATVAVPTGATVSMSVSTSAARRLAGPRVRAAPAAIDPGSPETRERDPVIYGLHEPWPEESVRLETVQFRELRLARLSIHPVRYRPDTQELLVTDAIDIHIHFEGGTGFVPFRGRLARTGRHLVDRHVLNRASVELGWRLTQQKRKTEREDSRGAEMAKAATGANPGLKIRVAEPGLVRLAHADLVAAGFDPTAVDPRRLQVAYRGAPVPCRVTGEADGRVDAGDVVEFYGVPANTRHAAANVYYLKEIATGGLRFPTRSAAPGTAPVVTEYRHVERYEGGNAFYTLGRPASLGDPHFFWVWFDNVAADPRVDTMTHTTSLGDLGSAPHATVRARFLGRTDPPENPDHRVRMRINGTVIGESTWNGQTFHAAELQFDRSLLTEGQNAIRIDHRSIATVDQYYLDWIELDYPRLTMARDDRLTITSGGGEARYEVAGFHGVVDPLVLDVTDPFAPVQLTETTVSMSRPYTLGYEDAATPGRRYHLVGDGGRVAAESLELDVPSTLRDTSRRADLIIIVPAGWEASLAPLVEHRSDQGRHVVLTNIVDVADEFTGGNVDDLAIRDFVRYAYENYAGEPVSHLLLVGEPNVDLRNFLERSPYYNLMPIHLTVTEAQGETHSDTWFGAVAGDDELPDVAVGRWSVRDTAQVANLVAKLLYYERNPPLGDVWGRRVAQIASAELAFEQSLAIAAEELPGGFSVLQRFRRDGHGQEGMRYAMSRAILSSFVGHGNTDVWADNPGGPFFLPLHVEPFDNTTQLTTLTTLNCRNGFIGEPYTVDSLAEAFHNHPDAAAVAVWSPAGLGFLTQYNDLQQIFYRSVFLERRIGLGDATMGSLVETFLTRPISIDLVREMILLGDPASLIAICDDVDGICDGLDDDCDGIVDEDFTAESVSCGVGACESVGTTQCVDGTLADDCEPLPPAPSDVTCDGIDDDCDGGVDEDYVQQPTTCGIGACVSSGETLCAGGAVVDTCVPGPPQAEVCDGIDNDCDGFVDNGPSGVDTDLDGVDDACDPDDDNDGVLDLDDCAPLHAGVAAAPGPIGNALWALPIDGGRVCWLPGDQGHTSDVYRGTHVPHTPWSYEVSCLAAALPARTVMDDAVPAPGSFFYYLVAARNACGESRMGLASDGTELRPPGPQAACSGSAIDSDADGHADVLDNCSLLPNAAQADGDGDFVGDACDNCPTVPNPNLANADGDPFGDVCDDCIDVDDDGFGDPDHAEGTCPPDNCATIANADQSDSDGDGIGDVCDPCPRDLDLDGDRVCEFDNCPTVMNPQQFDRDRDGMGDLCDECTDSDEDGFADDTFPPNTCPLDNCPRTRNPDQADTDGDGIGDACDRP